MAERTARLKAYLSSNLQESSTMTPVERTRSLLKGVQEEFPIRHNDMIAQQNAMSAIFSGDTITPEIEEKVGELFELPILEALKQIPSEPTVKAALITPDISSGFANVTLSPHVVTIKRTNFGLKAGEGDGNFQKQSSKSLEHTTNATNTKTLVFADILVNGKNQSYGMLIEKETPGAEEVAITIFDRSTMQVCIVQDDHLVPTKQLTVQELDALDRKDFEAFERERVQRYPQV